MQSLQTLLEILCRKSNIHICVHDMSGILNGGELKSEYKFHSKRFCDIAKGNSEGMAACFRCKAASVERAVCEKKPYAGYCTYGLYEAVVPVVIKNEVKCIVYVGNLLYSTDEALKRIRRACAKYKLPAKELEGELASTETAENPELCFQIADIVCEHIISMSEKSDVSTREKRHWAVESILQYIDKYYDKSISLRDIAQIYYINEKYIGRIFKQQVGMPFREYLRSFRLKKAKELLGSTSMSITRIAYETGFSDSAFFSSVFLKEYGITPREYRKGN